MDDDDRVCMDCDSPYHSSCPARPCLNCAAVGRLTWLNPDGSCRRSDTHR